MADPKQNNQTVLRKEDITVDQHLGVVPNGLRVKIYVNDETPIQTGVKVRERILENQQLRKAVDERIDENIIAMNSSHIEEVGAEFFRIRTDENHLLGAMLSTLRRER